MAQPKHLNSIPLVCEAKHDQLSKSRLSFFLRSSSLAIAPFIVSIQRGWKKTTHQQINRQGFHMIRIRLREEEITPRHVQDPKRPQILRPLRPKRVVGTPEWQTHRGFEFGSFDLEGDLGRLLGELDRRDVDGRIESRSREDEEDWEDNDEGNRRRNQRAKKWRSVSLRESSREGETHRYPPTNSAHR